MLSRELYNYVKAGEPAMRAQTKLLGAIEVLENAVGELGRLSTNEHTHT